MGIQTRQRYSVDERRGQAPDQGRPQTAADIYEVQPYYSRFNQKYNVTRQRLWNPPIVELERQRQTTLDALAEKHVPGYQQRDMAFYQGATANLLAADFPINYPNQRGNSWLPFPRTAQLHSLMLTHESSGRQDLEPEVATKLVRKMALLSGASDVGFCLLDRRWVYSHYYDENTGRDYPIRFSDEPGLESCGQPAQLPDGTQVIPSGMKYVVVMVHEMDEKGIATAPAMTQMATTLLSYSRISFSALAVAEFVRGLGYNAIPSANCTALSIPLAIDAGLGELGRNAKLITKSFGPRCRLSKVITDLPLETGRPAPLGVAEFCNVCLKCARRCPAGAIPSGPRSFEPMNECNHRGVLQWQVDHVKCVEFQSRVGTNCGICIRVCPFNKPKHPAHDVTRWVIKRTKALDPFIVWLDNIMGYGRPQAAAKFWDELE